ESYRPTNTGRLLTLSLTNSEIRIRGIKNAPMNDEGFIEENRETLLFYPSESAIELSDSFIHSLKKPINLVVPDGSWRQASKIMKQKFQNRRYAKAIRAAKCYGNS